MDIVAAGKAVVMGIVEGLTEFLPVSSTGHLIVAGKALGFEEVIGGKEAGDAFEVIIQAGAILAVCCYYRTRLLDVLRSLSSAGTQQFLINVLIAFLPAVVLGLLAKDLIKLLFNPGAVAIALVVGGGAIILTERWPRPTRESDAMRLRWTTALGIGLFQCLALFPGTSRSAATILGGMWLGVERRAATEFSFFLAIPTLFAATVYKGWKHRHDFSGDRLGLLAIGFVVSFIVAWAVIAWLLHFVAHHRLTAFGWYRLAAGAIIAGLVASGWLS